MREVPVAFPSDEASAEVIADRLRAEGIPARVDRGLAGSYQVPSAGGHLTVFVSERRAGNARSVLGTRAVEQGAPGLMFWATIGILVLVLFFAIFAVVMTVAR